MAHAIVNKNKLLKPKSSSYILELSLDVEKFQWDQLEKRFEVGRRLYNTCIAELDRRYKNMIQSKAYQKVMKSIRQTYREEAQTKHINQKNGTKKGISLDQVRKPFWQQKNEYHLDFGLSH